MRILVLGDNPTIAEKVRQIATHGGFECRATDVAPLEAAMDSFARARHDLTVLITSPDEARAQAVLRDLCSTSAGRIVAVGAAHDPKFLLQMLREGAAEFVDETELDQELLRSLVRIKNRPQSVSDGGSVIGVLGASGGSGTSVIASNLAVALAQKGSGTALFDLRLASGDLNVMLDLKPPHSLADLCLNYDRMDQSMLRQSLAKHSSGVHLLAAPGKPEQIDAITPRGVRQAIAIARTLFPFVILDLDRNFSPEQVAGIVQTDLMLLVMRLDMISLHNTSRAVDRIEDLGLRKEQLRAVVNRHGQRKELPAQKVEQALGMSLAHYLPDDPATVNTSINKGVPLVLDSPRSKIARGIDGLADDVGRHCNSGRRKQSDVVTAAPILKSVAAMLY